MTGRRLVPEVRADRNGRLVTRHVNPEAALVAMRELPHPNPIDRSKEDRAAARERLQSVKEATQNAMDELASNGVPVFGTKEAQSNIHHLVKTDPVLMEGILSAVRAGTDMERDVWTHEFSFNQQSPMDWRDETDYTENYRIGLLINPLASTIAELQPETTSPVHFARSLKYYVSETAKVNGRADDASWMKAVMLITHTVSEGNISNRNKWDFRTHGDDIKFLQENWERVEPVVPLLVQRHNATRAFIETLWESLAPSLSEGLL